MTISCLCPTYRRPEPIVANVIACFEAQTHADRELVVLDDAGELAAAAGDRWRIVSQPDRFATLAEKYNALAELGGDAAAIAVWEDDDVYLPWHLEAHARALDRHAWSLPAESWSLYTGELQRRRKRYHGALACRREAWEAVGGWPVTRASNFDRLFIGRLAAAFGPPGDPCEHGPPGYVFRWHTGSYHGQHFMAGSGSVGWYERAGEVPRQGAGIVVRPRLDPETRELLASGEWGEDSPQRHGGHGHPAIRAGRGCTADRRR